MVHLPRDGPAHGRVGHPILRCVRQTPRVRWIAHRVCLLGGRHISKRLRDSKQKSQFGQRDDSRFRLHTVTRKGMPKTPGHRLRTTHGTGGGGRRVLPPQLERVRLERPSRARPKDITHKAPRGRLRDHRGCQNSPPASSLFPPNSIVPKGDVCLG